MISSKDLDKLGIFNVITSRNHEKHRKKIVWYLRLSRLNFLYKIPPIIGWIQVRIAQMIGGAEWGIEKGNESISELKSRFPQAKTIEEKKAIQKKIRDYEYQRSINIHILKEWKLVADAIAWKILKYQRIKIRILSENYSNGLLNFRSEGTKQELATVMEYSLKWKLLIWSDLTNYIRIGDIVVRHSENQFEILEVKNNPDISSSRIQRQQKRMDDVTKIFNTNLINTPNGVVLLEEIDTPLTTYSEKILELIKKSKKTFVVCEKINDIISVCVNNYGLVDKYLRRKTDPEELKNKLTSDFPKKKHNKVMTCMSFDYLRRESGEFPRNLAPLTIFPFSPEIISQIISGRLLITVWIDLDELENLFKEDGWKIKIVDLKKVQKENEKIRKSGKFRQSGIYAEMIDDTLFEIKKGDYQTTLPLPLVIRLGYEFLTPQTLLNLANDFKKAFDKKRHLFGRGVISAFGFEFTREKEIWR